MNAGRGGETGEPNAWRRAAPPLAIVCLLLAAWEGYVRVSGISAIVLPSPSRIVGAFLDQSDLAARHTAVTVEETAIGFSVSATVAVLAAIAMDQVGWLRRAVQPLLVASQSVPIVALAPLLVLWFGFGLLPKVLVIVLVTFFPITVALLDGFAATSADATDMLGTMGATRGQVFRKLRWPAALPSFFTGLRISAAYAVVAAIFGEYVGAYDGLGIWMQISRNAFRADLIFVAIVIASTVSMILYAFVGWLEAISIPWYRASRRRR
jgi:ABC-type nitrate/sulfonate/bicarbonate transport system permease component